MTVACADKPHAGAKEELWEPSPHEVGTEEWKNDLSDVILPLPESWEDSDSDGDAAPAAKAPEFWEQLPPARVLELMATVEKHTHEERKVSAGERPEPLPGVPGVRYLTAAEAAQEVDRLVGGVASDGEPVMITGLADGWRARERWASKEAFVEHYGSMPLKVHDLQSVSGMGKMTELWLPVRDFVEYATTATADAPFYVFQKQFIDGQHDVLFEDYECPELFSDDLWNLTPVLRNAFARNRFFCMGGERTGSAMHVDPFFTGAWNTLLCGEKRWVLFPPSTPQEEMGVPSDLQAKLWTPCSYWWHDWYPRLAGPGGRGAELGMREVIQRPGDTIFVPAGWWHAVLNRGWTIAVTENQLSPQVLPRAWPPMLTGNRQGARRMARAVREQRPELLPSLREAAAAAGVEADLDEAGEESEVEDIPEGGVIDDGFRMW